MSRCFENEAVCHRPLCDFLSAGSSAFLLSMAHLYSGLWFLSIFALVPFLWRVLKTELTGSIRLGFTLAVCHLVVTYPYQFAVAPAGFLIKLIGLAAVFSGFGVGVHLLKRRIGFNPIIIAALWLPCEYLITRGAGLDIFKFDYAGSGTLLRFASLFGFLMVSFAIVLVNTMVLALLDTVLQPQHSHIKYHTMGARCPIFDLDNILPRRTFFFYPLSRAPPIRHPALS